MYFSLVLFNWEKCLFYFVNNKLQKFEISVVLFYLSYNVLRLKINLVLDKLNYIAYCNWGWVKH